MKKRFIAVVLAMVVAMPIAGFPFSVNASQSNNVTVIVDGRTIDFPDAPAYIDENGRTQLPARFIGEALGAHVAWDENTGEATISRRSLAWDETNFTATEVVFSIGSADYRIRNNDREAFQRQTMDTEAVIEQGRTYVPVRYVAEALGAKVDWNANTRTATITSETQTIGGFVVPKSYTDDINIMDSINATTFMIRVDNAHLGSASVENRSDIALFILSQKLDQDTINKLKDFIASNLEHKPSNSFDFVLREIRFGESIVFAYGSTFLDSKTRQYVRVLRRWDDFLVIMVFEPGAVPPSE